MKISRQRAAVAIVTGAFLAGAFYASALDSIWTSSSGQLPTQVEPAWHFATTVSGVAALEGGVLRISSTNGQTTFYHGDGGHELSIPTNLTMTTRMRVVSGTAIIYFVTQDGDAESALLIGPDRISLRAGPRTVEGPPANVDTDDAFHTYRIEVQGVSTGSVVRVYYDGTLTLTGALFLGSEDEIIQIVWGTLTGGESLWESFEHNAAAPPITLTVFPAVEICWASESNKAYQVQWSTSLPAGIWHNLGLPVPGNGSNVCVFDTTRGGERRFYRVEWAP